MVFARRIRIGMLAAVVATLQASSQACIVGASLFVTLVDGASKMEDPATVSLYQGVQLISQLTVGSGGVYAFPAIVPEPYTLVVETECYQHYSTPITVNCGMNTKSAYLSRVSYPIPVPPHSADQNGDGTINLNELLRVIQIYNSNEYHCDPFGEDGYGIGPGPQNCSHHDADYDSTKWTLSMSELLRVVQLHNADGYHRKSGTEDGFAPNVCTW